MNALPPLAALLPLAAAAALIAVLDRIGRRAAEAVALGSATISLTICCLLLWRVAHDGTTVIWFGGWHPGNVVGLGIAFAVDPAAAAVATLVAVLVTGALVLSREYFDDVGTIFYVLVLAILGAMIAFAYAADAFDLFVFYEVFSVAAYALAAYRIEKKNAFEGALQFALTNTVAGLFILLGIILLEGRTGELNLVAIGRSLVAQHDTGVLAASSLAFVSVGLFTRGALAPLHFWFDEAHANAPTPLCMILSGTMAPLALYGFARYYWAAYAGAVPPGPALHGFLIGIGIISALVGALMCLRETQLKRAVAFSTVAHGGAALVALGAFDAIVRRAVLCVETQAEVQDVFRKSLSKMGYRVIIVGTAELAAERYDESPSDAVVFDVDGLGPDAIDSLLRMHGNALEARSAGGRWANAARRRAPPSATWVRLRPCRGPRTPSTWSRSPRWPSVSSTRAPSPRGPTHSRRPTKRIQHPFRPGRALPSCSRWTRRRWTSRSTTSRFGPRTRSSS